MKASVIQVNSVSDKARNLAEAERIAEAAIAADAPDLIAFPENLPWCGGTVEDKLAAAEDIDDGPAHALCRGLATRHGIWVQTGSIPTRAADGRNANTSVLFAPDGSVAAKYDKIHMFDIETPDGQSWRESNANAPGSEVVHAAMGDFTAGLSVCYDMRFAELYVALAKAGVDVIFVPAAFTLQTGKDHWEVLLRSRAIETQSYVIAPAQTGTFPSPEGPRSVYGRSIIIDPWGTVIAMASDGPGWATARLDPERIKSVRSRMPTLAHRRL